MTKVITELVNGLPQYSFTIGDWDSGKANVYAFVQPTTGDCMIEVQEDEDALDKLHPVVAAFRKASGPSAAWSMESPAHLRQYARLLLELADRWEGDLTKIETAPAQFPKVKAKRKSKR